MSRAANFDVQEVIDSLQGSCQSLQECLESYYPDMDENDLTSDDHEAIDNQIFCCDTCNWWCEIGEQDVDGNCQDCSTADEDEDE